MTPSSRPSARRRAGAAALAGATALGTLALLGPGTGSASSHREAPYIQGDPAVDNTDTYAFVSPDKPSTVTFVANWFPLQEPSGGPNFYPWDTSAAYDINVDNNGDAKPDIVYRWTFDDVDRRGTAERGKVDGSFLYNEGPVTSLTDRDLLFRQTYDLTVITGASSKRPKARVVVDDGKVAPSHVGTASIPDYGRLRREAVTPLRGSGHGGRSYVGQADDPFFLDLRIFDLLYGGNFSRVGDDTLSGYNVNTIALQVDKREVAGSGNVKKNPVVGIWSTTSRRQMRMFLENNAPPRTSVRDSDDAVRDTGKYVQVSRLGNPLVNEVVVPANLKDFFNRSTPDTDAKFLPKVQEPEVPVLIEKTYRIPNPNRTPKGKGRPDLVQVFLTGVPGLNATAINRNNRKPAAAEYLRLNLGIAPTAKPKRLGVVAGDNAGYPNGRRLGDDVTDITLQVAEGLLVPDQAPAVKKAVAGLGDAVNANDKAFLRQFPYVADPHAG